jgi:hypothetical protein
MQFVGATPEDRGKAQYVGTEIDGRWWKRYRAPGFFARGNGTYRFEAGELVFDRALTKELTRISLVEVMDVTFGTWHAGTWLAGKPIVKVTWEHDGARLSSGFGFVDRPSAEAFVAGLRSHRPGAG